MSKSTKILVVDDDRDLAESIRIVLESEAFEVGVAYDASVGLSVAEAERPDLILLDVMMPGGTEGFHFVWQLRSREEAYFKKVPIIVLTAIHDRTSLRFYPDSADGTYKAGEYLPVQDFVDKPIDPPELLTRVRRALSTARR